MPNPAVGDRLASVLQLKMAVLAGQFGLTAPQRCSTYVRAAQLRLQAKEVKASQIPDTAASNILYFTVRWVKAQGHFTPLHIWILSCTWQRIST